MLPSFNPYGLTISLALLTAYWLTAHRAGKHGLSSEIVWDSLPWVVFSGLIGARLYHVLNFLPFYLQNLILIPQVWRGGLGIYGALLGGLVGFVVFMRIRAVNSQPKAGSPLVEIFNYLDIAAPGIALGQAIGRVGNIFNGENLPYAGWEIITDLTVFFLLIWLEKRQRAKGQVQNAGNLFFLYLFSYAVTRFILEFFRSDSPWVIGPLTMAQWFSLAVMTIVLAVRLVRLRSRH